MLDKEIETFRRDSYIEQFSNLEKKFSISLRKFKEWGDFVELGQRRNLFTHNDGIVNDQYLSVCDREGHVFDNRPKLGDQLPLNMEYFTRAVRLTSRVGLMLGYTLWAKVFPKELPEMQAALNNTLYRCLEHTRWKFVAELEEFVLSEHMRKSISEVDLRVRLVNVAIGLKFSDRPECAHRLLTSVDWTASYRAFRLAIAVLEENYEEAAELMVAIGKNGEILTQSGYHAWPLFTKFRENQLFHETYEKIYGESYVEQESSEPGDFISEINGTGVPALKIGEKGKKAPASRSGSNPKKEPLALTRRSRRAVKNA